MDGCARGLARGRAGDRARALVVRLQCEAMARVRSARRALAAGARDEEGQGTTEYAILVGVIVVIAIGAVLLFRGKIQELWSAITDGINSL